MKSPFFSIIIPTYNRAHLIGKTVEAILRQTFSDFELIIVDDGSTDGTCKVIRNIKDRRLLYFSISNGERGRARNYGVSLATGEYINFFDSDDEFLVSLNLLYTYLNEQELPPVVYGGLEIENVGTGVVYAPKKPYKSFTKNLLFDNFLACGSVFLKREIAIKFPFEEDRRLSSAEDWELWLRIHSRYDFAELNTPVFKIIEHKGRSLSGISSSKVEQRDNLFANLVRSNPFFIKKYGVSATNLFIADRYTFIALSHAVAGDKGSSFHYLLKSLKLSRSVIKRKRFWAVAKKLLFNYNKELK